MILVALYVLRIDIASGIEATRKKDKAALKVLKEVNGVFVSQEEIDKLRIEVNKANAEIVKVWGNVFKEQIHSMFWPTEFDKIDKDYPFPKHPFETGKFIRSIKETTEKETTEPNHFIGVMVGEAEYNYLRVKGAKDGKEVHFYRTDSHDKQFRGLAAGKTYDIFYQTARYFNDSLHEGEQSDYVKYYHDQIRPILDIVQPVNVDGEGVVQLGRMPGGWRPPSAKDEKENPELIGKPPSIQDAAVARYLRWVPKWNAAVDISEEAWLAQEDLWIQKEIYLSIRDANDQVSKMVGTNSEGFGNKATFSNPYFEIGLTLLSQDKLQVQLKNLRGSRQKLDIAFRIRMEKDRKDAKDWQKVDVQGEPLDPVGTKNSTMVKEITLPPGTPRTGIYEVEQVLTWETAAVRRIDHIAIGSNAPEDMSLNQRLFPDGVRPLVAVERKEDPDKHDPMQMMMGKGAGGIFTVNGLVRNRYIDVNEQSRRLPVGIALIVDQTLLCRIIKSFEKSKFRFVIEQTLLNRYPGTLRPAIVSTKDDPVEPRAGGFEAGAAFGGLA